MSNQYAWKCQGLYKADPDRVFEEINNLGEDVTPNDVLERARDVNSELHKCFEWNDTIAAEKYRLGQARHILCNLVYRPVVNVDNKIRVFYRLESRQAYVPMTSIVTDKSRHEELLRQALKELLMFKKKYMALGELDEIMDLIDEILDMPAADLIPTTATAVALPFDKGRQMSSS